MPAEVERPKFLMDLLAEVDGFDAELFKPNAPVSTETQDKVMGVLSPWQRKLFALVRYYNRQLKLIAVDRDYDTTEEMGEDREMCEMKAKNDLLGSIMWASIRSENNLWTNDSLGVRTDWQVVTSEPPPDDDGFKQFLALMMGRKK